jgi:hypothetical protein
MTHVADTLILWLGHFANWYTFVYLTADENTFFSSLLFWLLQLVR